MDSGPRCEERCEIPGGGFVLAPRVCIPHWWRAEERWAPRLIQSLLDVIILFFFAFLFFSKEDALFMLSSHSWHPVFLSDYIHL